MSFSYQFGANPQIDIIRLLVFDRKPERHVFEDSEIQMGYTICQSFFQSSMFFTAPGGANLPSSPVSYLRVAAILLDSIAANKSRLSVVTQLLDVKLDASKAAKELRDTAAAYRDTDDNSGAMMIIEQCNNYWSFRDRFWNQVQRTSGT